ncbi:hypothetical protein [Sinomonas albida]|uniref:hypothetical protein n=1 Tax=Sinomonas albida TaxID=369942 RepID=UPI0010A90079|nr:hypothetical protein [Sinomonas albida]
MVALIGENYVGKTSTVVAFCRMNRAELVADSLVVLDLDERVCLTYETPLGFRRQGLKNITNLLDQIEHRLTVSPDTGLVALVQPEAVLGRRNAPGGPLDHIVHLVMGPVSRVETLELPDLQWFTAAPPSRVKACLPNRAVQVQLPKAWTPENRATAVLNALTNRGEPTT